MSLMSMTPGGTWASGDAGSTLPAAYSDLVQLDFSPAGLLYETGTGGPYETIAFRRIALTEVTR